ncbi:ferredoxin [Candidatus Margulisiibacteriota bacterium]
MGTGQQLGRAKRSGLGLSFLCTAEVVVLKKIKEQNMAITKVSITEGCIGCGLCVSMMADVFEMKENVAVVREGAEYSNEAAIQAAVESCPVDVIKTEG